MLFLGSLRISTGTLVGQPLLAAYYVRGFCVGGAQLYRSMVLAAGFSYGYQPKTAYLACLAALALTVALNALRRLARRSGSPS